MKWTIFVVTLALLVQPASAITVSEAKLLSHARAELKAANAERDQEKAAREQAEQNALAAQTAANDEKQAHAEADAATLEAKKQAAAEHKALVDATTLLNKWKPVMDTINRWWGIGAIIYGFKRLAIHLIILTVVLVVLSLVLAYFFPPALAFFRLIWGRITAAVGVLIAKERARFQTPTYEQPTPQNPAPIAQVKRPIAHSSPRSRRHSA